MRRIRRLTWVLLVAMLCLLLPSFSAPAMAFTDAKYYIEVDIGNQIVTIYDADTMSIVRQMLCSAGKKEHWTPVGEYILQADERRSDRDPWYKIGDIYVRYATRLYGPVLFHSIPYYAKKTDCIDRDAVKLLGIPASHGCIRLRWQDARFIAENCGPGTRVKVLRSETRDDELRALLLQETTAARKMMDIHGAPALTNLRPVSAAPTPTRPECWWPAILSIILPCTGRRLCASASRSALCRPRLSVPTPRWRLPMPRSILSAGRM